MRTERYLTNGHYISNNTWETGLNNNDIICGTSGCGKTRGYVIPNIRLAQESMIICDTKGILYGQFAAELKGRGYHVLNLDFTDEESPYGYNPFRFIRKNKRTGQYREDDIYRLASVICPVENTKDPFWDNATKMFLAAIIAYTLEALPDNYHHFDTLRKLAVRLADYKGGEVTKVDKAIRKLIKDAYWNKFKDQGKDSYTLSGSEIEQQINRNRTCEYSFFSMIEELEARNPHSTAVKLFQMFRACCEAEKMYASILGILAEKLTPLIGNELLGLYRNPKQVDFKAFGREKTALFLTVSDTDRSKDVLANILYTQALNELIASADKDYEAHRLSVPVRFILDDFAAGAIIPDFDNIISVIRSREISVSIIIQSISQLNDKYGSEKAATILNNCDHMIYLGGQDIATAEYISKRTNKSLSSIIEQPLASAYLMERGKKAVCLNNETVFTKGGMNYEV